MRTKFKRWAVDYLNTSNNIFSIDDKEKILSFISSKNTYLEIGPGKGQFILSLAKNNKENNYLVCEINKTVAGICLKKVDEDKEINNIKMIANDFFLLTPNLEDSSIKGIYLNFSDPWPKKRHEKRRLTYTSFLKEYHRILTSDGLIYFKTDNDDFFSYSKDSFLNNGFEIIYENLDYKDIDNKVDAETEFETKYKEENIKIKRLVLKKK